MGNDLEGTVARNECHGGCAGKAYDPLLIGALVNPRCDLDHSGDVTGIAEEQPSTWKAAKPVRGRLPRPFTRL
jgi:hypothetical protein